MSIAFKTSYVLLEPTTKANVPNNAIFLDTENLEAITIKNATGTTMPVGDTSSTNFFIKAMIVGGAIPVNAPVSKMANGKIVVGNSEDGRPEAIIGHALQSAGGDGETINVLLIGANMVGALIDKGFAPGQSVFLGENGAMISNPAAFTGSNDAIVKIGIADCSGGEASSVAKDLIVITEIISIAPNDED